MLGLPKLPPIPIPSNVVSQLQLGCDAVELLRDIEHVLSLTCTVEGPWLPTKLEERVQEMIDRADEVY